MTVVIIILSKNTTNYMEQYQYFRTFFGKIKTNLLREIKNIFMNDKFFF